MMKGEMAGSIIFNRYSVGSCLGFGSFGEVYLTYDPQSESILAMKTVGLGLCRKTRSQSTRSWPTRRGS